MDRNETVELSRLAAFGGLNKKDIDKVITEYCIEHGKSQYEITMFINILSNNTWANLLLSHCFNIALKFYEGKFTVCKLWSAPDPLSNTGQRKLLQIF